MSSSHMKVERWAAHIDIEGFSSLWEHEDQILRSLGDLMEGIYWIGTRCYAESPNRIFAHQIGDGFIIVSEFGCESLEVPVAISIALMQHIVAHGRFARTAIAEGDFADISGCYPPTIREALGPDQRIALGRGLMTIFPVMGTALIRTVGVAKYAPKGSLLLMHKNVQARIPQTVIVKEVKNSDLVSVDWIHSEMTLIYEIQRRAQLKAPGVADLERSVLEYCKEHQLPQCWQENTRYLLSLPA